MNGSEKQIKWAEDIKAGKIEKFNEIKSHAKLPAGVKLIDYILGQEQASFWIDYRGMTPGEILHLILTSGLMIGNTTAKANQSEIVITWDEIVQDGKGGHLEKKQNTIKL